VFENKVLRRIFGPKRDELTGGGRTLHNEELHNLYQVKEDGMDRACSTHEERRNACRVLVGRPERRKPLGRSTRRLEDNIKIDLGENMMG
jgi:hypothetical protein